MKHDWQMVIYQPGHKRRRCRRCGAVKDCYNIYVRNLDQYSPATLNDKRQPFCPKKGA